MVRLRRGKVNNYYFVLIMETKQERRNRLYRERYAKNEAMRNRYQVKARAAIPERNEKRKEKTLKKRKESWKIAFGRKVYDINALILESYEHEKTMLMKLESEELFWKSKEGESVYISYLARRYRREMSAEEKKRYKEAHLIRYKRRMLKKKSKRVQKDRSSIKQKQILRSNFSNLFRRYRETKVDRMNKMIGCTWGFFASWIESKFTNKMKWDNYGSYWHIDHIEPLAVFDVYNNEHMRRAWHYTNLRPLSAKENRIKRDKIITHQPELIMTIY
jgi:5-methylcytosine-specific restriction endonuclease McrA